MNRLDSGKKCRHASITVSLSEGPTFYTPTPSFESHSVKAPRTRNHLAPFILISSKGRAAMSTSASLPLPCRSKRKQYSQHPANAEMNTFDLTLLYIPPLSPSLALHRPGGSICFIFLLAFVLLSHGTLMKRTYQVLHFFGRLESLISPSCSHRHHCQLLLAPTSHFIKIRLS